MTKARAIIEDALTFGLNRLSLGESADADTLAVCLRALNSIADAWNGSKAFLFREILTASGTAISTQTALLGTAWVALSPGDEILGATYSDGSQDIVIDKLTMQQYHEVPDKTQTGDPRNWAYDGLATVYLYPVPSTARTVTLRTRQAVSDFADLDTDYSMPKGYKAALADCVAELLAPTMNPKLLGECRRKANAARSRIAAQVLAPAILDTGLPGHWDINRGWV